MKKTVLTVVALMLVCAMLLAGCGSKTEVTLATGGTTGTYYSYGSAIATVLNDTLDTLQMTVTSTGASAVNIQYIQDGDADFAIVQNDVAFYAKSATDMYEGKDAYTGLRAVAALYAEVVHIVASTSVTSIADLAGKTVSIGDAGSGTEFNATQILNAYGISLDDINVVNLGFGDSAEALKNGQIDAFFGVSGAPATYVTDLSATNDFNLLAVDDEHAASLMSDYAFYTTQTIPAGTYKGVDEDVQTLSVMAIIVVDEKTEKDTVYNFIKGLIDNQSALASAHAKGELLSVDNALNGISVPLHEGAAKYFTEQGKDVSNLG